MNDEFLYALRRDPPAQFAHSLKRKLQSQDRKGRFWSLRIRTTLFLIAGAAVAGGMFVLNKRPAEEAPAAQPTAQVVAEASDGSAGRRASNAPTFVLEGGGATTFDKSQETSSAPVGATSAPESGRAPAASGNSIPPAEQTTAGGAVRPWTVPLKIATSALADPLIRNVLEPLAANTSLRIPPPEAMEAAAAFARLCASSANAQFDIVVTSRRITHAEFVICRRNGVTNVQESKLGYQALVLTSTVGSTPMKVSPGDVYLAIAQQIPNPMEPTQFIPNPNVTWDQVNAKLAYRPIALFGPARQGTLRTLFETLLLKPGCNTHRDLERLQSTDPERHAELCHSVRGDRLYSEIEQTASLIPQNLWAEPNAFVVVDYDFYRENQIHLAASAIEGPEPNPASFANGTYPLARPVYLYANLASRSGPKDLILRRLQPLQFNSAKRYGFVRLDDQESKAQQSRRHQMLSESELINERSEPR